MKCRKCYKSIPDQSAFCLYCGASQKAEAKKKKRTRRPSNTGTIRVLQGRNKPFAAYYPRRFGGKYINSFATHKEASDAILEAIAAMPPTERALWTVQQFYDCYINSDELAAQSKQMKASMSSAWKLCKPYIGKKMMRETKTHDWQKCIDAAAETGKSKATASNIRTLASLLCKEAMKDDVINKNYASLLKLHGEEKRKKDIFTADEIKLLQSHDGDVEAMFILILIYTGMRISELLTMQCDDVHFEAGYMQGGVKSDAGMRRIIPILPVIYPYVLDFYNRSGGLGCLIQRDGKPVSDVYARQHWFYDYLVRLGVLTADETAKGAKPRLTPHCTRHTFASMARESGIDKDVLTRIIGHSDYATTDTVYIDMSPDFLAAELKKIEKSVTQT